MCPKCGAYNRPPRRERVDPDGSIHYLEPRDAAVPPHRGKKVCYEQKTCYEEQTRRPRQPAGTGETDALCAQEWENLKGSVQRLWTRYQTMDKKQRGNVGKIIIAVVTGLVLLLNSCNIHRENNVQDEPDWSEGSSVVAVPEPTYPAYVDTNVMAGHRVMHLPAGQEEGFLPMPSARSGSEMIAPSGKFWIAMPSESASAPAAVICALPER